MQLEESNRMCEGLLHSSTATDSELQRLGLQLTQTKALFADSRRQIHASTSAAAAASREHSLEVSRLQRQHHDTMAAAARDRCAVIYFLLNK